MVVTTSNPLYDVALAKNPIEIPDKTTIVLKGKGL
jgi:hypothetical protein